MSADGPTPTAYEQPHPDPRPAGEQYSRSYGVHVVDPADVHEAGYERGYEGRYEDPAERSDEAPKGRMSRRDRLIAIFAAVLMLSGIIIAAGTYYFDSVPTPSELSLPESTTVFYADGKTPMATLGAENRTLLGLDDIVPGVKDSVVAAEDQTFWTNDGIDFGGVLRAAWNNVTGGQTQGASTITQQYARVAAELKGVTYSRKLREAVIAYKLANKYSKEQILEFYLNTVPFGRGAYGIEAAAQAFFGQVGQRARSGRAADHPVRGDGAGRHDQAAGAQPGQPRGRARLRPDPRPEGAGELQGPVDLHPRRPGQHRQADPGRRGRRWSTRPRSSRTTRAADSPDWTNRPGWWSATCSASCARPTGSRTSGPDYIENGGFQIVTTIDKRAQDAAEAAADITRSTAPSVVRGQPPNWQAGLVAVEPGTGRVLAYYGGNNGRGADYSGWYYDDDGNAVGFGQHPPGSSFKVYDLAEALRQNISLRLALGLAGDQGVPGQPGGPRPARPARCATPARRRASPTAP